MRLGANVPLPYTNPDEWIAVVRRLRLGAVCAPMGKDDPASVREAYMAYIRQDGLVIGEVGVWRNTIDPDTKARREAIAFAQEQLAFADEIGARCCVNIVGAAGAGWDRYYPENYTKDTYALIVDSIREIVDGVKPRNTFYALEPMSWMHPDSPDDYLQLLSDIGRDRVAVHLDFANMINSFARYANSTAFVAECIEKLGPHIKSIHAKDIKLGDEMPCCLRECPPGMGDLDFAAILRLCETLGPDTPVFVEHMSDPAEYEAALAHLRGAAGEAGVSLRP